MKKKILVVDDELHVVNFLVKILKGAGYAVISTCDSRKVIDLIDCEKPDLVILDWLMPHIDGMELLQKIRLNPATHDLKVVMLSAKAQDKDIHEAYQTGADMYLTKPFKDVEILTFAKKIFEL